MSNPKAKGDQHFNKHPGPGPDPKHDLKPDPKTDLKTDPKPDTRPDWKHMRLWQIQPIRDALIIFGVLGVLYLGYELSIVTVPILIALLLAYLFEPLVAKATRRKWLSRPGAALSIVGLFALVVVVPLFLGVGFATAQGVKYAQAFASDLDVFVRSVESPQDTALQRQVPGGSWRKVRDYVVEQKSIHKQSVAHRQARAAELAAPAVSSPTAPPTDTAPPTEPPAPGVTPHVEPDHLIELPEPETLSAAQVIQPIYEWLRANSGKIGGQALQASGGAVSFLAKGIGSAWLLLFGLFLTAFFFFFFSTSYGKVLEFWRGLIPEKRKNRVLELLDQMDRVISGFVRGRITIAFLMMVFYSLAYLFISVPAWLILGPIVGLATLVPYLSSVVGVPIAMLLLALEPSRGTFQSAWWWIVFAPIGVSLIAQVADDYILNPRIQGKSTDMDTPSILFASLAGGVLAGFYGLLIAIPVAACTRILLREVFWPRFRQWAQGRARDFLPIEPDA